jgi:hypothetical protein
MSLENLFQRSNIALVSNKTDVGNALEKHFIFVSQTRKKATFIN